MRRAKPIPLAILSKSIELKVESDEWMRVDRVRVEYDTRVLSEVTFGQTLERVVTVYIDAVHSTPTPRALLQPGKNVRDVETGEMLTIRGVKVREAFGHLHHYEVEAG